MPDDLKNLLQKILLDGTGSRHPKRDITLGATNTNPSSNEGAVSYQDVLNPEVNLKLSGAYQTHLQEAVNVLNLAVKENRLSAEAAQQSAQIFRSCTNALEVYQTLSQLSRDTKIVLEDNSSGFGMTGRLRSVKVLPYPVDRVPVQLTLSEGHL